MAKPSLDAWRARRDADRHERALVGLVVLEDRGDREAPRPKKHGENAELVLTRGENDRMAFRGRCPKGGALAGRVGHLCREEPERKVGPHDHVVLWDKPASSGRNDGQQRDG